MKRLTLHTLLGLAILAIFSGHTVCAQQANPQNYSCAEALTLIQASYNGKSLELLKVDPNKVRQLNLAKDFGEDQVFLSVEEPHHYYLVVGKLRFDGEILKMPSTLDTTAFPLNRGLYIHFKNLPESTVEALRAKIKERAQFLSFSCVNEACRTLGEAGIKMKQLDEPVYLGQTLEQIFKDGFVGADGAAIEYDLIYTSDKQVPHFVAELNRYDEQLSRITARRYKDKNVVDPDSLQLPGPLDPQTKGLIVLMAKKAGLGGLVIAFMGFADSVIEILPEQDTKFTKPREQTRYPASQSGGETLFSPNPREPFMRIYRFDRRVP